MAPIGQWRPSDGADFEFVECHLVRNTDDYIAQIDEYRRGGEQFLLAHLGVKRWSPAVMRQLTREFAIFRKIVVAPLFCTAERDDAKFQRFISHFGFRFLQNVTALNGAPRRLYVQYESILPKHPITDTDFPLGAANPLSN